MELRVKVYPLVFQDHINVHKHNIEYNPIENVVASRVTPKPLPSMSHDSLFHNPLNPPTSNFMDS